MLSITLKVFFLYKCHLITSNDVQLMLFSGTNLLPYLYNKFPTFPNRQCHANGVHGICDSVCMCVCVRALKEKRPEQINTKNGTHVLHGSPRYALTRRSNGQRSRSHGYENRHGYMAAGEMCCCGHELLLLALHCTLTWLLTFLVLWTIMATECPPHTKNKNTFSLSKVLSSFFLHQI